MFRRMFFHIVICMEKSLRDHLSGIQREDPPRGHFLQEMMCNNMRG